MSRIAKHPVVVPAGVDVKFSPEAITVKGKNGELSLHQHAEVNVALDNGQLVVTANDNSNKANALSGDRKSVV